MKVYTVPKLASLLDISERKVRDLLRTKELKGYKKLNKWFVLHADLINYLIK